MQQNILTMKHRTLMALLALAIIVSLVLSVLGTPRSQASAQTTVIWRVNGSGQITKNGVVFPYHGGNWFGLEGRHEPSTDPVNPSGAPMEQYLGNTFWANTHTRTIAQTMNEIKTLGINVIRLPLSPQTLNATDPQGMAPNLKNHSSVLIANSRLALETMIKAADAVDIQILLDIHSCSNYLGWRAGRIDARPPYVDANRANYDFKRENTSCAANNNPAGVTRIQPYDEAKWLADLRTLAGLGPTLGVDNIIGIDIFNEPWDYNWAEWKRLSENAYAAIDSVNPNILIFVEGISDSANNQDGITGNVTEPHGDLSSTPNWGENLFSAGTNPLTIPQNRLVFSPHTYGPSVAMQPMFVAAGQPQCVGLLGDAIGDARCNLAMNPTVLRAGWQEHFGYLKDLGYAVVIGEFGGNMDWPNKANLNDQARYSYLTDKTFDQQWQNALVDYMIAKGIEGTYWSINPESGDTAGIYGSTYDPVSNPGGWGEWTGFDTRKTSMLQRLWAAQPPGITPTPTQTQPPSANLALLKPVTCSSTEAGANVCANAVDGNATTRWASLYADPQWIRVDLGASKAINRVVLRWEAAYGKSYQIQTSNDDVNWTTIYSTTTGDGAVDDLSLTGTGRYVRMYGTARGTAWGYSLFEFEVYGPTGPTSTPTVTPTGGTPGTICEKFGTTPLGNYTVMNNKWGTDAAQCINVTGNGFQIIQQDGIGNLAGAPVSYPAIYAGCHYTICSPNTNLPMRISDITSAQSNVTVTYPGTGVYDAAYDIWLNADTNVTGVQDTEIMIWLNHTGTIQPIGSNTNTTFNAVGTNWKVWVGNNGANNVVSYVAEGLTSLNGDLKPFLLDAITRGAGFGNTSWYLTSAQMGFEPWQGGVGLAVNSFSFNAVTGGVTSTPTSTATVTKTSTVTNTPTVTLTGVISPTGTMTNTPTRTNTPITPPPGGLKVQYKAGDINTTDNQARPYFIIVNGGTSSVPLSALKVRYYLIENTTQAFTGYCDYAVIGCGNVTNTFASITPVTGADRYIEFGFTAAVGNLAAGASTGEIQGRFNKNDWSPLSESDDYSFDATKTIYTDWTKVTLYNNGTLVWGTPPGGSPVTNTPTATVTATATKTLTVTPTVTGPTPTFTKTLTATSTVTASKTSTVTATSTVTSTPTPTPTGSTGFITRSGDKLMDGTKEFRFISINIPNLFMVEDPSWHRPDAWEQEDALKAVEQIGGRVVRTYTLTVKGGTNNGSDPANSHVTGPGQFNEELFKIMDKAVALAGQHHVRLIIPFVDQWDWVGGVKHYSAFRGKTQAEFWTDAQVRSDFKQTIAFLLNRTNTVTGIQYKNDPTILAWETGNEIYEATDGWTRDITAYIKSIDTKHLVVDGKGGVNSTALNDPNIDIVTSHYYNYSDKSLFTGRAANDRNATRGIKPFFVGEYGLTDLADMQNMTAEVVNNGSSGALIWSLRFHNVNGGWYFHDDGNSPVTSHSYHWPGFPQNDSYFETSVFTFLRNEAYRIQGLTAPARPAPDGAPLLFAIDNPNAITWRGSTGATGYNVERADAATGPWTVVGTNVSDMKAAGPFFNDTGAIAGRTYYYRVIGKNASGSSAYSNVVKVGGLTGTNLAIGKLATGSCAEATGTNTPDKAVDGNTTTRWSSCYVQPAWLMVDLGQTFTLSGVKLNWEAAYGRGYEIQVSNDGVNWTTAATKVGGTGGIDTLIFPTSASARYVRMYGTDRGTTFGFSLWEFEIYGN